MRKWGIIRTMSVYVGKCMKKGKKQAKLQP